MKTLRDLVEAGRGGPVGAGRDGRRAVMAFLLLNLPASVLFVGGALLVSFIRSFATTPAQLGGILSAGWAASVLGALSGQLADRVGRGREAVLGHALMGAGWLLFPSSAWLVGTYAAYGLYCLGNSMGYYASVFALDVAPEGIRGRAGGLFDAAMHLGSTLGDGAGRLRCRLLSCWPGACITCYRPPTPLACALTAQASAHDRLQAVDQQHSRGDCDDGQRPQGSSPRRGSVGLPSATDIDDVDPHRRVLRNEVQLHAQPVLRRYSQRQNAGRSDHGHCHSPSVTGDPLLCPRTHGPVAETTAATRAA